jgi:hypothetical protein
LSQIIPDQPGNFFPRKIAGNGQSPQMPEIALA